MSNSNIDIDNIASVNLADAAESKQQHLLNSNASAAILFKDSKGCLSFRFETNVSDICLICCQKYLDFSLCNVKFCLFYFHNSHVFPEGCFKVEGKVK